MPLTVNENLWGRAVVHTDPHHRQAELSQFICEFDDLVDTLCIASREGLTVGRAQRYQAAHQSLRSRFLSVQSLLDPGNEVFTALWAHEDLAVAIHTSELILLMAECRNRLERAAQAHLAALNA